MSEAKANQEPSMEEILASIRRIISEEGPEPAAGDIGAPIAAAPAAAAPVVVAPVAAAIPPATPPKMEAAKPAPVSPQPAQFDNDDDEDEELVLTDVVTGADAFDSNVVPLKPEAKMEPLREPDPFDDVELALDTPTPTEPSFSEPPMPAAPAFQTLDHPLQPAPASRPAASLSTDGARVDPEKVAAQLSAELPDLVAPAVADATSASFAQLLHQRRPEPVAERPTGDGLLVETLVRQAVEPMVRDWLDTHLEAIVEQMVRREIERLSRKAELS